MAILQTLAPIVLQPKKSLKKRIEATRFFKILSSPKTTLALGSILLGLVAAPAAAAVALRATPSLAAKLIPKTPLGAVKAVAGVGLVSGLGVSGVKKITKKVFTTGKTAGEILRGDKPPADILGIKEGSTFKEKLITGAKAAGVVGLIAAAGIGGKKLLDLKKKVAPALKPTLPGVAEPRPVGLGGIPVAARQITPIGAPGEQKKQIPISNIIQIQVS